MGMQDSEGKKQKENIGFRKEETRKRMQDSEGKKPERECRIQKGRNQKENVG